MKKIFDQIKTFLEIMWFPILILALFTILLYKVSGYQDQDTIRVVLGIMLGVALGFLADILKRSLDQYRNESNLKKTALRLLQVDAEKIYESMKIFQSALDNIETAPTEVQEMLKSHLPPKFELKYWDRLSQDNSFLLLGSASPFKEIFNDLWDFEKINNLIDKAIQKDQQSYMFAKTFYDTALKEKYHENLLKKFMSDKVFNKYIEKFTKMS